jgi:hypothetical protein
MPDNLTFHIDSWPALMRLQTAAAYLDCSTRTIDSLQRRGYLIPIDSGFGKRFARKELDKFINERPDWRESE